MFPVIAVYVCACALSDSVVSDCLPPHGLYPGSSVHGISHAGKWGGLPFPSPEDLLNHKDQTHIYCRAGGFFTAEPPGKPYKWLTVMKV